MGRGSRAKGHPIGLALAGGGPFGAIYEIGALIALEESLDRLDLARRRAELEPIFSRHGIRMRREVLEDSPGGLKLRRKPLSSAHELRATAGELRDALVDLRRCVAAERRQYSHKMAV